MIRERLEAIAALASGVLADSSTAEVYIQGVSTDTRSIQEGNLFVPLVGERFNGHEYAEAALRQGAAAVLWQEDQGTAPQGPVVLVEDTLAALQRLASGYRDTLQVRIVGITGSNGKTTTKDMTAAVLETTYRVYKTQGNYNNHIGLPLTLLALSPDTEFAVLEMGMSGRGEIDLLTKLSKPNAVVITNIGDAHLLQLGSREEIAKAKLEIIAGLQEGGTIIVPGDETLIHQWLPSAEGPVDRETVRFGFSDGCDLLVTSVTLAADRTLFELNDCPISFEIPMLGKHNATNATAAIAVGRTFGISDERIAEGLASMKPTGMRIERIAGKNGTTLWNDAYNASPTSMKAALALLSETSGYRRKFAVLGDMLELGPDERALHRAIGEALSPEQIDYLYTFGNLGREITEAAKPHYDTGRVMSFASKEALAEKLANTAGPGDLILVKASRGMKLETIIEQLREQP